MPCANTRGCLTTGTGGLDLLIVFVGGSAIILTFRWERSLARCERRASLTCFPSISYLYMTLCVIGDSDTEIWRVSSVKARGCPTSALISRRIAASILASENPNVLIALRGL